MDPLGTAEATLVLPLRSPFPMEMPPRFSRLRSRSSRPRKPKSLAGMKLILTSDPDFFSIQPIPSSSSCEEVDFLPSATANGKKCSRDVNNELGTEVFPGFAFLFGQNSPEIHKL